MRTPLRSAALAVTVLALAGCTQIVALSPAEDAKNAACAEVVVRLPEQVAGFEQRKTDAQGTGAWGDPTAIILYCGVPVPDPTSELPCRTVDGVDWLIDDSEAPNYILTTYGRDPAIQVIVDNERVGGGSVATDLAPVIRLIPADRQCISPDDLVD